MHGELAEDARTLVFGFEQGEARSAWAFAVGGAALDVELPPEFDPDALVRITRLQLAAPLEELGLVGGGALPLAPDRPEPLETRPWLAVDAAEVQGGNEAASFAAAEPPEWLRRHPVSRPKHCLQGVREELIELVGGPRDLLSLGHGRAAALSFGELFLFEEGAEPRRFDVPGPGRGQVLGPGALDRIWVVTTSAAIEFDPATGLFGAPLALPEESLIVGVAEDPGTRELYLYSSSARLWRRAPASASWESLFEVPSAQVRPNLHKQVADLHFLAPRHLLVASEDVGVVLELEGDVVRTHRGVRAGSGFPVLATAPGDRVFVAEAALGDLFEFRGGRLDPIGQVPTRLVGLVVLDAGAERFLHLGASGAMGTYDAILPADCPERPLGAVLGPKQLVRVGARLLVLGTTSSGSGFIWLDVEL